jgi:hypothetical protein
MANSQVLDDLARALRFLDDARGGSKNAAVLLDRYAAGVADEVLAAIEMLDGAQARTRRALAQLESL